MKPAEIMKYMEDYNKKVFSPEDLKLKARSTGTGGFVRYYGNAKFHIQAGEAFAKALLRLAG